ncbi:MAG: TetR/AcrR family transcriptional regulator [Candidatus Izemoplasmatales bacterium]|nr:TetR/AcrR family transcriptional regulator [Candidatus Izemoplasmatales bacterium]
MPTSTFLNLEIEKKARIIKAAIDEFSEKQYEQVQISDIIKHAKIPRGSFYQYFTDKEDLYLYLIDIIRNEKMKFLQDTLSNYEGLNFLDLVRKLYDDGVKFALKFPQYVKILDHLLKNKNEIYDKLMSDNIKIAEDIYANLIDKDKTKGLIKEDIDTRTFAKIIVQLTTNIAVEELDMNYQDESYQKMLERNNQVLKIIEQGVLKG